MAECYECGAGVPSGHGYRREVYTGHSTRIYHGRRVSGSTGSKYGIRTLCASCAIELDKRRTNRRLFWAAAVLGLILLAALSHDDSSSRTTTSAASIAGPASAPSVVDLAASRKEARILARHRAKRLEGLKRASKKSPEKDRDTGAGEPP